MAADWIPCELGLFKKAEVLSIARKTRRTRHDVGGLLLEFWGWCSNESADGIVRDVGLEMLPSVIGGDRKFWDAVVDAGWLHVDGDRLVVPNAERWISRGAKARLTAARRKQKQRDGQGRMSRPERDAGHAGGETESVTTVQNSKEERERELSECFAEFWSAYPRHDGRAAAEKAWRKLAPPAELREVIQAAVDRQRRSRQWADRNFIPYASTWLNGRRWEDEPEPAAPETPAATDRPFVF